jgi:hypothetical protein
VSVKFDQAIAPSYEHLRPNQSERCDTFPVYPEPREMLVNANKPVTSGRSSRKHTMASEITDGASATTAHLRPGGVISVRGLRSDPTVVRGKADGAAWSVDPQLVSCGVHGAGGRHNHLRGSTVFWARANVAA